MIIRELLKDPKSVYPTTISKLLLCKYSINKFLESFSKMTNRGTVYSEFLLNSHKKFDVFKRVTSVDGFVKITDWGTLPDGVIGPFLNNREIVFYNTKENLMCVFTYFPLHALKDHELASDVLIREIKSYVFDNVESSVTPKVIQEISLNDLLKYKSLTTRFSVNSKKIFKIVRQYDEYRWEFVDKDNEDRFETTENHILMEESKHE